MFDIREKPDQVQRAFLIGAYFDRRKADEARELLIELKELVETLHINVIATELVFAREHTARHFIGKGKAAELMAQAHELQAD
jgi:GTP-binding protein HflX